MKYGRAARVRSLCFGVQTDGRTRENREKSILNDSFRYNLQASGPRRNTKRSNPSCHAVSQKSVLKGFHAHLVRSFFSLSNFYIYLHYYVFSELASRFERARVPKKSFPHDPGLDGAGGLEYPVSTGNIT